MPNKNDGLPLIIFAGVLLEVGIYGVCYYFDLSQFATLAILLVTFASVFVGLWFLAGTDQSAD